MHAICESCALPDLLKEFVASAKDMGSCSVCGNGTRRIANTGDPEFLVLIKALIRYYHSEWEYHGKLSDGSLQSLFGERSPIIKFNLKLSDSDYEDFLLSFLERHDQEGSIHLFTAYGRDIYNYLPMRAVSLGEAYLLSVIRRELMEKNYFIVEKENEKKFEGIRAHITRTIEPGEIWHRARVGATRRAANYGDDPQDGIIFYEPFADESLAAPPVGTTSAGRLNRPGVSFLYLASDPATALSEVRPHPGEQVSLGAFSTTEKLIIADLSTHRLKDLYRSDDELDALELIIAIENALATAAPPSNRQLYSLTQFIAELLRQMGFDGVKFRSTVGAGVNLVLFDPSKVTWIAGSSQVADVKKVQYSYVEERLFDPNTRYD